MRKPNHCSVLTETICATEKCNRRIKKNLFERKGGKGKDLYCYKCYRIMSGAGPEKKKKKEQSV